MIKKFIITALCMVLICSSLIFVGCKKLKPFIKVSGIKTQYVLGEEEDFSAAKVLYYEDESSKFYTELNLTTDMIEGFSTATVGTFIMTITYKDLSTTLEYQVLEFNSFIEEDVPLLDSTLQDYLNHVIDNMCSYIEIREITKTYIGESMRVSYRGIRRDKRYCYQNSKYYNWLVQQRDKTWMYYTVEYDDVQQVNKYTKYHAEISNPDLRILSYENLLKGYKFVDSTKVMKYYWLKFESRNDEGYKTLVTISRNLVKSIEIFDVSDSGETLIQKTQFTYLTGRSQAIRQVPNVTWEYGGEYFE